MITFTQLEQCESRFTSFEGMLVGSGLLNKNCKRTDNLDGSVSFEEIQ